ncbi:UvrD-helicase domain-containing protein [Pseudomonadota bacterium]
MFTWTESELNTEQGEAVRQPGSIFLVACPGSGKTRTLTYKIADELSRLDSDKKFVVAITYTHRAADEIHERIEDLGVDTSRLWIGTIHSFCLEWIIKPYGIYLPELERGYQVIDQHEREKLLERLCEPYSRNRPKITFYDCDYYFTDNGYLLGCPDQRKHPIIHSILDEYFRVLADNRQIDFELILWHAFKLIEQNASISMLLSMLFSIVLVDEYQDTKKIQYLIIAAILRAGMGETKLFMVGDPNQAIYGSLGGYPIAIDELRTISGIPINERELSRNYRSSERVIEYFGNFNIYNTTITAVANDCDYPSIVSYNSEVSHDNLVYEIVKIIRHNVEVLGIPPNEICVLAPQWFPLATMTRKLVVNMPDYRFDGPGMVPFARDIQNFWYKLSKIALTEPSPVMYVRRLRWAVDVLSDLKDAGAEISNVSGKLFLRECNSITINESNGLIYLRRFFDVLFERLDIQFHELSQLEEYYQAFFASSESRIARIESEGLGEISDIRFFKKVFQNRTGVTVSTIHGVKGAEFDVVIAYALLEGMVPHFSDVNGVESAQKMLYVVGSRARKNLHLFSEAGRKKGYSHYEPTSVLAACYFDYDEI